MGSAPYMVTRPYLWGPTLYMQCDTIYATMVWTVDEARKNIETMTAAAAEDKKQQKEHDRQVCVVLWSPVLSIFISWQERRTKVGISRIK